MGRGVVWALMRKTASDWSGECRRDRGKDTTDINRMKLVSRCFDCNRFRDWSGDPICHAGDR